MSGNHIWGDNWYFGFAKMKALTNDSNKDRKGNPLINNFWKHANTSKSRLFSDIAVIKYSSS